MRVLAFLLVLTSQSYSLSTSALSDQGQRNSKEPEEINQFFFLDSTGDIRPLEQQAISGSVVPGDSSTFRFVQGEPLAFVVKLASQDVDPTKTIQLLRLSVKGENRTIGEAAKGSKKALGVSGTVLFEATEYGESSFKIKPKADLGPGEYVLKLRTEKDGYCFAVDPVKTDLK